ncbi:hypothetical protein ACFQU9_05140 [Actinomadura namibiensis]|uniref:hypothetical protein n=1 Tax=Actinomadura kijaniata TaxID=46161 RepID=UPI00160218D1|nr:hypothetical protein [Actinomadura namibiensis]
MLHRLGEIALEAADAVGSDAGDETDVQAQRPAEQADPAADLRTVGGELVGGDGAERAGEGVDAEGEEGGVEGRVAGPGRDEARGAVECPVDGAEAGAGAGGGADPGADEADGAGALAQGPVDGAVGGGEMAGGVGEDRRQFVEPGAVSGGRVVQRYLLGTVPSVDGAMARGRTRVPRAVGSRDPRRPAPRT